MSAYHRGSNNMLEEVVKTYESSCEIQETRGVPGFGEGRVGGDPDGI